MTTAMRLPLIMGDAENSLPEGAVGFPLCSLVTSVVRSNLSPQRSLRYTEEGKQLPGNLPHVVEDRTYDSADYAAFDGLPRNLAGDVFFDRMRQFCDRQRLQPDSSRAGEGGEKESVAAEDHVLDAGHGRDLE